MTLLNELIINHSKNTKFSVSELASSFVALALEGTPINKLMKKKTKDNTMDTTIKYVNYEFLGRDFLTKIYYDCNTKTDFNFELGQKIVFTKFNNDKPYEKTTISGDYSDTQTAKILLSEGALITELQLLLYKDSEVYTFTLKAADIALNGLKMPKIELEAKEEDMFAGSLIIKVNMIDSIFYELDLLYKDFINLRCSDEWNNVRNDIIVFTKELED